MRKEWECPDNCPNRKPCCQNPDTCEIYEYATRMKRSMEMHRGNEVRPYKTNFRNRSVITARERSSNDDGILRRQNSYSKEGS